MSLRSVIVRQFKKPQGLLGSLAGTIMANRPSNVRRNEWTVGLLSLEPQHRILEIGCGPGLALKSCAARLTGGKVTGIDHSELMVRRARKRLSVEIGEGRAVVRTGDAARLSEESGRFDRVFSLNVAQFLPDLVRFYSDVFGILSERGMAATTYQPRLGRATRDAGLEMTRKVSEAMHKAGFVDICVRELELAPASAFCVTGFRPTSAASWQAPTNPVVPV